MQDDSVKTVLVVSQSAHTRDQICLALSLKGCLIKVTGNESAALSMLEAMSPDVLLLEPSGCQPGPAAFRKKMLEQNPLACLVLIVPEGGNSYKEWSRTRILKAPFTRAQLLKTVASAN